MGLPPLGGGAPDGSIFLRSSLKGSSFFEGLSRFLLSLLSGGRSRGAPRSLRGWLGVGEWELAEDTGLARSAYMSSESALRTELPLDDADDTDDTLLTLSDLRGGCCCRSLRRSSLGLGVFAGSRGGGGGLPAPPPPAPPPAPPGSRGFVVRGFPPSGRGLGGLPCGPPGGGLGAFFIAGFSLRGGGTAAPGFGGTPLANAGGGSGLFFAFLGAAGLGEGDVENDRDLERLPLNELCWEEWLE